MSELNDLDRLANAWEAQHGRRERARAGWQAGVRPEPELSRLVAREPSLVEPEAVLAAREALAAAPESKQPALRRLTAAFVEWRAFARSAATEERLLSSLSRSVVRLEAEVVPLSAAEQELRTCTIAERRRALARAVAQARSEVEPLQAELHDRRLELLAEHDLSADAAWGPLHGFEMAPLVSAAEALLKDSEGPFLEALDFRLRRERLDARAGSANRAELELVLELLALREHLSPGQVGMVVGGLGERLGLEARGGGRITADVEASGERFLGSGAAPFSIPGEIAVLATPVGSPGDLDRLVSAYGQAWHWAGIDARLPIADRVAPDRALMVGSGVLLASILELPSWHRRVLRLPSRSSDEVARAFALRHLADLRRAAAQFLVGRELRAHGATEAVRDSFRGRMSSALGGDWGAVGWLDVDPAASASELRGLALGIQLATEMPSRFDEDWWRNPHASELLRDRWSRGGEVVAEATDLDAVWRHVAERAVG